MNAPTSTITHVPTEPKRWRAPEFTQPVVVKPRDLKPLGELRGYHWFRVAQYDAEWAERLVRLSDADTLPDGLLIQYDDHGERSYSRLDVFAPGSFAKFTAEPPPRFGPPVPKALRAVEAIPIVFAPTPRRAVPKKAVAGRADMIIAVEDEYGQPPIPVKVAPKAKVRGPEAILAHLRRKGVVLALAADKVHLLVQTEGGHPLMLGERALVEASAPLLVAHLRGEPLTCGVKWAHAKGTDTAITLLVGGCPCCAACLAERAS